MAFSKTIRSAATAALLCFTMLLSGCGARASAAEVTVPVFPPLPGKGDVRIAVASDLHFDPDNRPHGEEPAQAAYNMELADALLRDAREQGADFLLLSATAAGIIDTRPSVKSSGARRRRVFRSTFCPETTISRPSRRRPLPRSTRTSAMTRLSAGTPARSATAWCGAVSCSS